MPPLIDDIGLGALIGDKGFDADALRTELDQRRAVAVNAPKASRTTAIACDFAVYRWQHLIENLYCDLKQNRRSATGYDKTDQSFAAMIHLAASRLSLQ